MTLHKKIMQIYPALTQLDFITVITLQNDSDGRGDYIAKWEHPNYPRPTDEQLGSIPDKPYIPIPQHVPMWAVRTVLQSDNLFDQADALVKASTDNALKNVWEYGNFADRNSNAVNSLATAIGLTSAQVDQMFIDANNLVV